MRTSSTATRALLFLLGIAATLLLHLTSALLQVPHTPCNTGRLARRGRGDTAVFNTFHNPKEHHDNYHHHHRHDNDTTIINATNTATKTKTKVK
jgi:hypothetical protein